MKLPERSLESQERKLWYYGRAQVQTREIFAMGKADFLQRMTYESAFHLVYAMSEAPRRSS